MPYPYSSAGGGLTSVAWGDITGSLGSQTDLQSALNLKLEGVEWGEITGTLSDQSDLQAALDAKEDAAASTLDATDNTYWTPSGFDQYSWSGTEWAASTYDTENDDTTRQLDRTGTWDDSYRPTSLSVTVNSGADGTANGGDLDYEFAKVELRDGFGSTIATAPMVFTNWNEDVIVTLSPLTFYGTASGNDIDRLVIVSKLQNNGPTVKLIEFTG